MADPIDTGKKTVTGRTIWRDPETGEEKSISGGLRSSNDKTKKAAQNAKEKLQGKSDDKEKKKPVSIDIDATGGLGGDDEPKSGDDEPKAYQQNKRRLT